MIETFRQKRNVAGEQAQRNILIPENRVLILENRAETVPQNVVHAERQESGSDEGLTSWIWRTSSVNICLRRY